MKKLLESVFVKMNNNIRSFFFLNWKKKIFVFLREAVRETERKRDVTVGEAIRLKEGRGKEKKREWAWGFLG